MKETAVIVLKIGWTRGVHTDPRQWDWVELIDPDPDPREREHRTPVEVVKHDAFMAYALYVGENLERITSDGWVPVCFEEFIESEECLEYISKVPAS